MIDVCRAYPVSNQEYEALEDQYGKLAEFIATKFHRNNSGNNHTEDRCDFAQEVRISMIRAGSYRKRHVWVEAALAACATHARDEFSRGVVQQLCDHWRDKRSIAEPDNAQKRWGVEEENMLQELMDAIVPEDQRPDRNQPLAMNAKTGHYVKSIMWNQAKAMGKKITREKSLRQNTISFSSFDYLQPSHALAN